MNVLSDNTDMNVLSELPKKKNVLSDYFMILSNLETIYLQHGLEDF